MITIHFDLATGLAKLAQTTTIKQGATVPVVIVFSAEPGEITGLAFALGTDAAPSAVLAYADAFAQENATTWHGTLDTTDSRLAAFMATKGATAVNAELVCTIDGNRQTTPNVSVTVQPPIITGAPTSEGGPTYLTEAETAALFAPLTVSGKYRIKSDGTFQFWNSTQTKWHTLTLSGAEGMEVLSIGVGES